MIITLNDFINPNVGLVITQHMLNNNFDDVYVDMEGITPGSIGLKDFGFVIMRANTLPFNLYTVYNNNTSIGILNSSKFFINFRNRFYFSRIVAGNKLIDANRDNINNLRGCKIVLDLNGLLTISQSNPYRINGEVIYSTPIHSRMHYNDIGKGSIGHSNDSGNIYWVDEDRPRYGLIGAFECELNDSLIASPYTADDIFKFKKKTLDPSKYIQVNDTVLYDKKEYIVTKCVCRNYKIHPKDFIYLIDSEGNTKIKYRSSCTLKTKFIKPKKEKKEDKIKKVILTSTTTAFAGTGHNPFTTSPHDTPPQIQDVDITSNITETIVNTEDFWNELFQTTNSNTQQ